MLDINMLRKQLPDVVARLATRPFAFPEKEFNELENERKAVQTQTEELQAKRNQLSKEIGIAKKQRRLFPKSSTNSPRSWTKSSITSRKC